MTDFDIMQEVLEERKRQDSKWGEQNHEPSVWLSILTEEVGEASEAFLAAHFMPNSAEPRRGESNYQDMRKELIQVAAVAIAIVGSLERNQLSCPYCQGTGVITLNGKDIPCPAHGRRM